MKRISWTSELETGLSALDIDHQILLDLVNHAVQASEDTDHTGLKFALQELQAELVAHFAREEFLMAECKYEAIEQHRFEHQQLAEELQNQLSELDAGKQNFAFISRFMRNWILQHIVGQDSLFGDAVLTQNGTTDRRQDTSDTQALVENDFFEERRLGNLEPLLWSTNRPAGFEETDAEHRALIDLLNEIILIRESTDKTELATLLEQFGNQTAAHFRNEERLMTKFNYPHTAAHKEEHRKLLDEFASQVDDWRENRISAKLLCRFMYRWMQRHNSALDASLSIAAGDSHRQNRQH